MTMPKKSSRFNRALVAGAVSLSILVPTSAHAAFVDWGSFTAFVQGQFSVFQGSVFSQFANVYKEAAGQYQQMLQNNVELAKLSNLVGDKIKQEAQKAVSGKFDELTKGKLGEVMKAAGVSTADIEEKMNLKGQNKRIQDVANSKNPTEAATNQAKALLEQQMEDRLNVTGLLDEPVKQGKCKVATGDKCTVLVLLKDQEIDAVERIYKVSYGAGIYREVVSDDWRSDVYRRVKSSAQQTTGRQDEFGIIQFLTPGNSIPAGATANDKNPHTLARAQLLADVMAGGRNDARLLAQASMDTLGKDDAKQLDALSRVAKIQLARVAITNVHNDELQNAMNSQFRACVARPDAKDRIGASQEQHLSNVQSLLRCTNMTLLQLRQQEYENQRIQGAILLTLLDMYSSNAPGAK